MICNRRAFVLATGCPQISVDINFPQLSFCSDPEYTDPHPCDQCVPQILPEPDVNRPDMQKCLSVLITIFDGLFTHVSKDDGVDARIDVKNTQATGACNASRVIAIQPLWGCPLMTKFPRKIPFINANMWTAGPFGALNVVISTFCSVEINGDVDLRLILPKWDEIDIDDVCINSGFINLDGEIRSTDPEKRFTNTKAVDETCEIVTRKLTYILTMFKPTSTMVTQMLPRHVMTCFIQSGRAKCSLASMNITRVFNVIRFVTEDTLTHTFMATGISCKLGNCCTIEKMTIVTGQKVISRGTFKSDRLIYNTIITLKLKVPTCKTMLSSVTSDHFYGKITFNRRDCGIDGKIIIRDYGFYRKMSLHKLSTNDAILSVHFGDNEVQVIPKSTFPCDILPPKLVLYVYPVKRFPIIGKGDIAFNAIGESTYLVVGADDLTIWSGVTGTRGTRGPTGYTGDKGAPGYWWVEDCHCAHEGECIYGGAEDPCVKYPAVCQAYNGVGWHNGLPGELQNIRSSGHDLIIKRLVYDITFEFQGDSANINYNDRMISMRIHGVGVFCTVD